MTRKSRYEEIKWTHLDEKSGRKDICGSGLQKKGGIHVKLLKKC